MTKSTIATRAASLFSSLVDVPAGAVDPEIVDGIRDFIQAARGQDRPQFQAHPFGFLKWTIGEFACGDRQAMFRLHVWLPGSFEARPVDTLCHSHAWALMSVILAGDLHNTDVELTDSPKAPGERFPLCTVRVTEGSTTLAEPTGKDVAIEAEVTHIMAPFELYRVPRGHFHRTTIPSSEKPVITLAILYERSANAIPMSLHRPGDREPLPHDHHGFDESETTAVLALIDQALAT